MNKLTFLICACLTFLAHLTFYASASAFVDFTVNTEPGSGISVTIESPFEKTPFAGSYPVYVEISNDTSSEQSWIFRAAAHGSSYFPKHGRSFNPTLEFSRQLSVPSGQRMRFELIVPLPFVSRGDDPSGYRNVRIEGTLMGYGISYASFNVANAVKDYSVKTSEITDYLVFMKGVRFETDLTDILKRNSLVLSGTKDLDISKLPNDWRGLSGVSTLWMTSYEYQSISSQQRSALRQWLSMGGDLYIITDQFDDPLIQEFGKEKSFKMTPSDFGLGTVNILHKPDLTLDEDLLMRQIKAGKSNTPYLPSIIHERSDEWDLHKRFSDLGRSSFLIALVMLAYGIMVGPINIFLLAPKAQRSKVYITTPLLATAASLLLCITVLLQDRLGGEGYRSAVVYLHSAEKEALIFQEQVSKKGLLFNSTFHSSEKQLMTPLSVHGQFQAQDTQSIDNDVFSSGWFGSRSVQAHFTQLARPTRARIELLNPEVRFDASNPPLVMSHVNSRLQQFMYRDKNDQIWHAENIDPGKPTQLAPKRASYFHKEFQYAGNTRSPVREEILERVEGKDFFAALLSGQSEFSIDSIAHVEWKGDVVVLCGPIVRGAQSI